MISLKRIACAFHRAQSLGDAHFEVAALAGHVFCLAGASLRLVVMAAAEGTDGEGGLRLERWTP